MGGCVGGYLVLVMAVEAICHLIYPIKWQHVYIPVLYNAGVGFTGVPTPYVDHLNPIVKEGQDVLRRVIAY
ncbi:unnamed protein product [Sphagnum troendelagicum]|uniref:cDENN domain-containing protein n=1 Tax=Sphagnum troendelagicum TaxID=128251 RepID=A0ABP0UR49_9BRYO